jgi:hypothetical protein
METLKIFKEEDKNREHYHVLLDRAMDQTKEGESFLPIFVSLILKEIKHE